MVVGLNLVIIGGDANSDQHFCVFVLEVVSFLAGSFQPVHAFPNQPRIETVIDGDSAVSEVIRRTVVTDGDLRGVYIAEYGRGLLEQCEITHNAAAGIELPKRSDAVISAAKSRAMVGQRSKLQPEPLARSSDAICVRISAAPGN
jgi:hypothetical protein